MSLLAKCIACGAHPSHYIEVDNATRQFCCPECQSEFYERPDEHIPTLNLESVLGSLRQKRRILFTDTRMQLVVQRLEPGDSVERERHTHQDQFVRVERGTLRVLIYSEDCDETLMYALELRAGATDVAIIPTGTWHQLLNDDADVTLFYTIYAPPVH